MKKLIIFVFILTLTFLFKTNTVDILNVFSQIEDKTVEVENKVSDYIIYYDDGVLTTENILEELSFLDGINDVRIVLFTKLDDEFIEYIILSNSLEKNIGEFFQYCVKKYEENFLDDELVKAYSKGIVINSLKISMSQVLANNYLQNKKNLRYQIIE